MRGILFWAFILVAPLVCAGAGGLFVYIAHRPRHERDLDRAYDHGWHDCQAVGLVTYDPPTFVDAAPPGPPAQETGRHNVTVIAERDPYRATRSERALRGVQRPPGSPPGAAATHHEGGRHERPQRPAQDPDPLQLLREYWAWSPASTDRLNRWHADAVARVRARFDGIRRQLGLPETGPERAEPGPLARAARDAYLARVGAVHGAPRPDPV